MRKILFAAVLSAAAFALSPSADARGLTTTPDPDGAMLIPTHMTGALMVIPVQYWRHHHYYRHRYYRGRYHR